MIRKSLYALAAALMTVSTFSTTIAVMTANESGQVEVA
jgi:hypothetical protein